MRLRVASLIGNSKIELESLSRKKKKKEVRRRMWDEAAYKKISSALKSTNPNFPNRS